MFNPKTYAPAGITHHLLLFKGSSIVLTIIVLYTVVEPATTQAQAQHCLRYESKPTWCWYASRTPSA